MLVRWGAESWKGVSEATAGAARPRRGFRLTRSLSLSYVSLAWVVGFFRVWLFVGWGWRWQKPAPYESV